MPASAHGQPEQQAEQRRLAGPVGADQAVDLAGGDVEVDAVQGDHVAKRFTDPARTNCKLFMHCDPLMWSAA